MHDTEDEDQLPKLSKDPDFHSLEKQDEESIFNLYSNIFGENAYTRTLAFLLDFSQSHNLKASFAIHIAAYLGIKFDRRKNWTTACEVNWKTPSGRLVDLLVRYYKPDGGLALVIGIENKILSAESENQISDYQKALTSQFPACKKKVVYLTPAGSNPKTGMAKRSGDVCPWVVMGYNSVISAMEESESSRGFDITNHTRMLLRSFKAGIEQMIRRGGFMGKGIQEEVKRLTKRHPLATQRIIQFNNNSYSMRRLIYERVVELLNDTHAIPCYVMWHDPSKSGCPREFNLSLGEINRSKRLSSLGFHVSFMLYSENPIPERGSNVRCLVNAYFKAGRPQSSLSLLKKISSRLPEPKGDNRAWGPWHSIWAGCSYRLQGTNRDAERLAEITAESYQLTHECLAKHLL